VGDIRFVYHLCPNGKHVEPEQGDQAVIAAISDMRTRGVSLRRIAIELNDRGLPHAKRLKLAA